MQKWLSASCKDSLLSNHAERSHLMQETHPGWFLHGMLYQGVVWEWDKLFLLLLLLREKSVVYGVCVWKCMVCVCVCVYIYIYSYDVKEKTQQVADKILNISTKSLPREVVTHTMRLSHISQQRSFACQEGLLERSFTRGKKNKMSRI